MSEKADKAPHSRLSSNQPFPKSLIPRAILLADILQ
jgi:hypothetical protein